MNWQKFNGETLHVPILQAVEDTIIREHQLGNKLKIYIGTDSQVKRRICDGYRVPTRAPRWIYVYPQRSKDTQHVY